MTTSESHASVKIPGGGSYSLSVRSVSCDYRGLWSDSVAERFVKKTNVACDNFNHAMSGKLSSIQSAASQLSSIVMIDYHRRY